MWSVYVITGSGPSVSKGGRKFKFKEIFLKIDLWATYHFFGSVEVCIQLSVVTVRIHTNASNGHDFERNSWVMRTCYDSSQSKSLLFPFADWHSVELAESCVCSCFMKNCFESCNRDITSGYIVVCLLNILKICINSQQLYCGNSSAMEYVVIYWQLSSWIKWNSLSLIVKCVSFTW